MILLFQGENIPFKPFTHRYHVPFKTAQSTSPLWYSIKRASAYIIVLSSYSAYGMCCLIIVIWVCNYCNKKSSEWSFVDISGTYTPQYQWLQMEFTKVKREETPWLIVMLHSPWYNSYDYHYMEGESMRVMFEPWFVQNKVDLVLSGHVHAYERSVLELLPWFVLTSFWDGDLLKYWSEVNVYFFLWQERVSNVRYNITNRLSTPIRDINAPMYITIGDGGNIEGLANRWVSSYLWYSLNFVRLNLKSEKGIVLFEPLLYRDSVGLVFRIYLCKGIMGLVGLCRFTEPQPSYSAFREASFGHAMLEIKNRTHAYYTWHRNHDNEPVAADSLWIYNRYWYPEDESSQ